MPVNLRAGEGTWEHHGLLNSEKGLGQRRRRYFYFVAETERACSTPDVAWEDRLCVWSCLSQAAVHIVTSPSPPEGNCSHFTWHVTCVLMQLTRDESQLFCRGRFCALAVAGQSLGMFTRPDRGMTLVRGHESRCSSGVSDGKLGLGVDSALNNMEI